MSRINRLARSLVAVRPFPLTDQMKVIIAESTAELKNVMAGFEKQSSKVEGDFVLWYEEGLSVHNHVVSLSVRFEIAGNEKQFQGVFSVPYGKYAFIRVWCSQSGVWKGLFYPGDFYRNFQVVLHHELIHLMDIKHWSPELNRKFPQYKQPTDEKSYAEYAKHPTEKSAFEGMTYYYFHNAAYRGIPLKESVDSFMRGEINKGYRKVVKEGGGKDWKDYKTRIYKSAEQAYADVEKEWK